MFNLKEAVSNWTKKVKTSDIPVDGEGPHFVKQFKDGATEISFADDVTCTRTSGFFRKTVYEFAPKPPAPKLG